MIKVLHCCDLLNFLPKQEGRMGQGYLYGVAFSRRSTASTRVFRPALYVPFLDVAKNELDFNKLPFEP